MDTIEILLDDMNAWDAFVDANREVIEERYGTAEKALHHVRDGGLELGGGAQPLVVVYFADIDPEAMY